MKTFKNTTTAKKSVGLLIICFSAFAANAQNKIVLKDQSYIKDAEYQNVKNSIIEYLQYGSLHDIETDKVLFIEKPNGSHLYFDEKGNAYEKPTSETAVVTPIQQQTNLPVNDSLAKAKRERERRRLADIVKTDSAYNQPILQPKINEAEDQARRTNNYATEKSDFSVGYVDGKLYRSRVKAADIPFPMDVNKLPIPNTYVNSSEYKRGFVEGIRKKQSQRNVMKALIITGAGVAATIVLFPLIVNYAILGR
jgi:hypothetical protein